MDQSRRSFLKASTAVAAGLAVAPALRRPAGPDPHTPQNAMAGHHQN